MSDAQQLYVHGPSARYYMDRGEFPRPMLLNSEVGDQWVPYEPPVISDPEVFKPGYTITQETPLQMEFFSEFKPLEEVKKVLGKRSEGRYFKVLNGGISLPNGVNIDTALEDRAIILATKTKFDLNPELQSINFKSASGWIVVDNALISLLVQAIQAHETACAAKLTFLLDGINSATTSEEAYSFYNDNISEVFVNDVE